MARLCKAAEPIQMPLGTDSWGARKHVLDGVQISHLEGTNFERDTYEV